MNKDMIKRIYLILLISLISTAGILGQDSFTEYSETIEGSDIKFEMVPIKGGEFMMGSDEKDLFHKEDEAPKHKVKVDSFWMGKFEITWEQFELFLNKNEGIAENTGADAITRPSPPYEDPSFGMGKYGFPAASMTQYSALMFCKWLSTVTGNFYRLPTEAEWEYACRAGSDKAYSFGKDVEKLDEYGWYYDNSQYKYQKVGEKKPNDFGLYLGSVLQRFL